MEGDERAEVHIGHAVAIGHEEGLTLDVLGDFFQPRALEGLFAGAGQGHLPAALFVAGVQQRRGGLAQLHGDIVVHGLVVEEIVLDHLALVAQRQGEVRVPLGGEDLHDVPEDGPGTDADHGLGPELGFFAQAGAQAPAEDDDFHVLVPSVRPVRRFRTACRKVRRFLFVRSVPGRQFRPVQSSWPVLCFRPVRSLWSMRPLWPPVRDDLVRPAGRVQRPAIRLAKPVATRGRQSWSAAEAACPSVSPSRSADSRGGPCSR